MDVWRVARRLEKDILFLIRLFHAAHVDILIDAQGHIDFHAVFDFRNLAEGHAFTGRVKVNQRKGRGDFGGCPDRAEIIRNGQAKVVGGFRRKGLGKNAVTVKGIRVSACDGFPFGFGFQFALKKIRVCVFVPDGRNGMDI